MFEQAFKNIDDVLRKEAGCTTELDYTEQTSWLLFLKYLDGLEQDKADEARLEGKRYSFILDKDFRWESWAAPKGRACQVFRVTDCGYSRVGTRSPTIMAN
jgi:type I restriction enzyme M protein